MSKSNVWKRVMGICQPSVLPAYCFARARARRKTQHGDFGWPRLINQTSPGTQVRRGLSVVTKSGRRARVVLFTLVHSGAPNFSLG